MIKNKPMVTRSMCEDWGATQKWTFDYLEDKSGDTVSLVSSLTKSSSDIQPWGFNLKSRRFPSTLRDSLQLIANNTESTRHQGSNDEEDIMHRPILYFLDDDLLRNPELKTDY